jgi:hypothetical protein
MEAIEASGQQKALSPSKVRSAKLEPPSVSSQCMTDLRP